MITYSQFIHFVREPDTTVDEDFDDLGLEDFGIAALLPEKAGESHQAAE